MNVLRLWEEYSDNFVKYHKPKCSICTREAIGDFYDRDWQAIKLCKVCKEKLEEDYYEKMYELR